MFETIFSILEFPNTNTLDYFLSELAKQGSSCAQFEIEMCPLKDEQPKTVT